MIVIADAGEIKARITIEYDGSGVAKAKEDLASLADISGGFEQAAQDIGGNLSGLSDQFTEGVVASEGFSKTVEALQKPLGSGGLAITQLSDALGKGQDALSGTGAAFEALQEPLGATVTMLQAAPEPIAQIAQHAESLQKPLASVSDNFAAFGDTLTQSVPLLPQFADSLHEVSAAFDPKEFGLDTFQENMSVFQDALVNPEPFSMIKQHLNETGQTWNDFSSAIGDDNSAYLEEMAKNSEVTHKVFGGIQEDLTGTGKVADTLDWETIGPPTDWTKGVEEAAVQTENLTSAAQNASNLLPTYGWSPASVNTGVMHGPLTAEQAAAQDAAFASASEGGLGLGDLFMPMMAIQMVGMAFGAAVQGVQQFMTNVYQMATLMEGPAAHSAGTFTGTVDAVGQSVERASMQFSESFGQQFIPVLDVFNNIVSGSNGSQLGTTLGGMANGALVAGLDTLFPGAGQMLLMSEVQTAAGPQPVPMSAAQRYTMTALSQMPQTVDMSAAQMGIQADQALAESMSPDYLAAVRKNNEAQQILQQAQLQYNATHPALSRQQLLAQYQFEQYAAGQGFTPDQIAGMEAGNYGVDQVPVQQGPADISDIFGAAQGGGLFGSSTGISSVIANMYRGIFNGLGWLGQNWDAFGLGVFSDPTGGAAAPGCFPAGTRVKMADGSERAIETLAIGDQVSAHDGEEHATATITALIRPPAKMVYKLTFSDGNQLMLTDAHPVMTAQGWKSLSPRATRKENPKLVVAQLKAGDRVLTADESVCTLIEWHPLEKMPVYNITVDGPHTFYANGVLVHNKIQSNGQGTQTEIDHTFIGKVTWMAEGLENTFTGIASWIGQGLTNTFTGITNWIGQGLENTFTAVASWFSQGLEKDFEAVASWTSQGLQQMFTAVANWFSQGLEKDFTAVANWAADNLEHLFNGVASWVGENLEHTFTAVANWVGQGLSQTFTAVANWVGIPGYAQGIMDSPDTHVAVVGENGPEIMVVPRGASIFPNGSFSSSGVGSAAMSPLQMGSAQSAGVTGPLTLYLMVDSTVLASTIIPQIAPVMRAQFGVRR